MLNLKRAQTCLIIGLTMLLGACTWPRDPQGTTDTVRDGILTVGLTENAPWVTRDGDQPGGIEFELVQQFAAQFDAEVEWHWGTVPQHLEALEQFEIQLAIGGLRASEPGVAGASLTQPYYNSAVVIGLPENIQAPDQIDGATIAVLRGSALTNLIRQAGAEVVLIGDPAQSRWPVAAPDWQLQTLNLQPAGITLEEQAYVMVVPPGENGWLVELDRFLQDIPPLKP